VTGGTSPLHGDRGVRLPRGPLKRYDNEVSMRKKKTTPRKQWANTKVGDGEWLRLPDGAVTIGCCDCGLVHDMIFRVRKQRVEMMVCRNDKSTKDLRAEHFHSHKSRNGYYQIRVLSYK